MGGTWVEGCCVVRHMPDEAAGCSARAGLVMRELSAGQQLACDVPRTFG
jgi:hypothetical protein